jgi:3D (Asp-Asp-Asp) domain-containing protein
MLISRKVTATPVTEVAELGVGGTFVGKDGIAYSYSYYIDVQATCYGKADGSGDITYTGTKAREGIIAVDPRVIPLNSKVYVTGSYRDLGVLSAEDTGGAIKGNIIDVYLEGTLQNLLEFGRRNMRAYVLE